MRIKTASKVIGKVVEFEDGEQLLLISGGIGTGCTFVFRRMDPMEDWQQMGMKESLPYIVAIAKQVLQEV